MESCIKIEMGGGYLIAERTSAPSSDGVCVTYQTKWGDIVDVVAVECSSRNIDVYCYEDEYLEDCTKKYTLDCEEILKSFAGEDVFEYEE